MIYNHENHADIIFWIIIINNQRWGALLARLLVSQAYFDASPVPRNCFFFWVAWAYVTPTYPVAAMPAFNYEVSNLYKYNLSKPRSLPA